MMRWIHFPCAHCGANVRFCEEENIVGHETPICEGFKTEMEKPGVCYLGDTDNPQTLKEALN